MFTVKKILLRTIFIVTAVCNNAVCKQEESFSGIIFKGISVLGSLTNSFGIDFYLQRPCNPPPDDDCVSHIEFRWTHEYGYIIYIAEPGYYKDIGKINLDSIKSAPTDSQMQFGGMPGIGPVAVIAPDSLPKCIGNVYIIKTGRDPRRTVPMYAKIKILRFTVRDSAKHEVDMGFLWACNISGSRDLATTGLDTFNLGTPTILTYDKGSTRLRPAVFARPGKYSTFLMLHGRQGLRGVRVGGVGLDGRRRKVVSTCKQ